MENEVEVAPEVPVEAVESVAEPVSADTAPASTTEPAPVKRRRRRKSEMPIPVDDGHCPACAKGQPVGTGVHVFGSLEHPASAPTPPPEKAVKHPQRAMHKELRGASSFAEKNLPKKIAEKAKLLGELARCEAEIQELVRVIQALGGQFPAGMPAPMPNFSEIQQPYQPARAEKYDPTNPQHNPMIAFRTAQAPALPGALRGGAVGSFDVAEVLSGPQLDDGLPPGDWVG